MSDPLLRLAIVPFILLLAFIELRDRPTRVLKGSDAPVATPPGQWEKAKPLPSSRYEFASVVLEDKIYTIGGVFLPSVWFPSKLVERYDPATDTWQRMRDYPIRVHHAAATVCDGLLYVVGGNGLRIIPRSEVFAYNPKADVWERRAPLPVARGALGAACLDGRIYAVGGGINKRPVAMVDAYNPATDTWTRRTPMPTAREHLTVVAAAGRVFALGGYSGTRFNNLTANEAYDPKTDTWEARAPLPYAVSGLAAAAIGDSIFVFGGEQGWAVSDEVHEYRISQDRWIRRKDLPLGRYALTASVIGKRIHVIGGNDVIMGYRPRTDHDIFIP